MACPFLFHHFLNIFPKIVGKNVKATYICETKANNMTTINIFIEQGPEGIDVDFYANVKGLKPNPSHFDIPEAAEIVWPIRDFTREENKIIGQYLADNYQAIESRIIAEACKPVNPYQITPLH